MDGGESECKSRFGPVRRADIPVRSEQPGGEALGFIDAPTFVACRRQECSRAPNVRNEAFVHGLFP